MIMPLNEENILALQQFRHWWMLARKNIIKTVIDVHLHDIILHKKLNIADIGIGAGVNTGMLRQYGEVCGYDCSPNSISIVENKWGSWVPVKLWAYPSPIPTKYDLILMSDIAEHFEDDSKLGEWLSAVLVDGGHAIITSPAYNWLWSSMDELVGHYRRYTKATLSKVLQHPDLEIVYSTYWGFTTLPFKLVSIIAMKLLSLFGQKTSMNDMPPRPVNALLKALSFLDILWLGYGRKLPFGSSVLMIVRKK